MSYYPQVKRLRNDIYHDMIPVLKGSPYPKQVLQKIRNYFPDDFGKQRQIYIETNLYRGELLWLVARQKSYLRSILSSPFPEILCFYRTLQQMPQFLIDELLNLQASYERLALQEKHAFYQQILQHFHRLLPVVQNNGFEPILGVYFLFLNKTCRQAQWIRHPQGHAMMPFGAYQSPCFVHQEAILATSYALQKAEFMPLATNITSENPDYCFFYHLNPQELPSEVVDAYAQFSAKHIWVYPNQTLIPHFLQKYPVFEVGYKNIYGQKAVLYIVNNYSETAIIS